MNEKVLIIFAFLAFLTVCSVLPTNVQQQTSLKVNGTEQKNPNLKVVKNENDNKPMQIKNIAQASTKQEYGGFTQILPQSCVEALVFAMRDYAKFVSPDLFSEISLAIRLIQHSSALTQFLVNETVNLKQHEKNNRNNSENKTIINYPKPQSPKNNKGLSSFKKGSTGSKSRDFRNDQFPYETGNEPIAGCLHTNRCPRGYLCRYNICISRKVVEKIDVILEERKNNADQDYEWSRWDNWDDQMVKNQPEQQQNQAQDEQTAQDQQSGGNLNQQSQVEYSEDEYDNGNPLEIQEDGETGGQWEQNEQQSYESEGQYEEQNVQGTSDDSEQSNDYQQQYYPMSPSRANDG